LARRKIVARSVPDGKGVAPRFGSSDGIGKAACITSDFEALRSCQGQAAAILVAYDIMEADGQDVRPEALEERRKRLAKLLEPMRCLMFPIDN
jgi:hypothetical protein